MLYLWRLLRPSSFPLLRGARLPNLRLQCTSFGGDAAIAACTEAIKQNSGYWKLYSNRGTAWSDKKEYHKAIADFSEAIRVDPKQVLPYSLRGLAWGEMREWDKAIADYNEAMRVYPIIAGDELNNGIVANLYRFRGTAWLNKRDYDKAISIMKRYCWIQKEAKPQKGISNERWKQSENR
jgi:tetratricopeptide (TPR) repeat protein